jgi:glutathione S-transferase
MPAAKLWIIPSSHPCLAVERALEMKGIEYKTVDLLPLLHKPVMKVQFGQATVPGLELDGERIVGSRRIMARLDELAPEPPLYPADPDARAQVQAAEAWGDEVLQSSARRLIWWLLSRAPEAAASYGGEDPPLPAPIARLATPGIVAAERKVHGATDAAVQADLTALPAQLDRIDAWIAEGVLGGATPNAADLQIGSSLMLLVTMDDLAPLIEGRPCRRLVAFLPDYPGQVPAGTVPPAWMPQPAAA